MPDQFFKKRQGIKKKRKVDIKDAYMKRHLIICEGWKTEPLYFESIKNLIDDKFGKNLKYETIEVERIEIEGTGRNTRDLVEYAIKRRNRALIPYGNVWCVFDKDSFLDSLLMMQSIYAKKIVSVLHGQMKHLNYGFYCILNT